MKRLHISRDLSLPLEVVTQTIGVLAKRRAGKSYAARKISEQLVKAGQQIVIVDPKGDQWGIRSAADGISPGLPIVILGGERADVPLEVHSGEVVAKLVVEDRVSVLLDLSLFRKHEVATFMASFLENLYRLKAREVYRTPVMLIIDEADAVAPQKPMKGEERMLGAAEDIVRRGGQRGIGCALITQRSAVINKNVLTQIQILITLRTIAPQDLAAIDAWIDVHGTEEERRTLKASLPSLPTGDAWIWSPGWPTVDGIFERVHVAPIETFDSGATPKPGEKRIEPKNLADVDLDVLKRQMAATIEKAKATDPKELTKTINELRARVRKLESKPVAVEAKTRTETKTVEKRVVIEGTVTRLEKLLERGEKLRDSLQEGVSAINAEVFQIREALADARKINEPFQAPETPKFGMLQGPVSVKISRLRDTTGARSLPTPSAPRVTGVPASAGRDFERAQSNGEISRPMQKILDELAELEAVGISPADKAQLGLFCGYTNVKSGGFTGPLGKLREAELIHYPGSGEVALTDTGRAQASETGTPLTITDLQQRILSKLDGPRSRILRELITIHPHAIGKAELGEKLGYTNVKSGGFTGPLGSLRKLGLIEYPQSGTVTASALLFPEGL